MYYMFTDTPAGALLLTSDGQVITGIYWKVFKRTPLVQKNWIENKEVFTELLQQLDEYFAGRRTEFTIPYAWKGTEFQQNVWKELEKIPHGTYSSYQKIAIAVGKPKAVRAVGTAVGSNPLSIVVPCHRVLSSSVRITGYAGGLESKARLLAVENIIYKA